MFRLFRKKKLSKKHARRLRFGTYQQDVNNQTGAMGPTTEAFWPYSTEMKNPWSMSSQPLYFDTSIGKYINAFDSTGPGLPVYSSKPGASFGRRKRSKSHRVRFGTKGPKINKDPRIDKITKILMDNKKNNEDIDKYIKYILNKKNIKLKP
jgi:hypothetical protein